MHQMVAHLLALAEAHRELLAIFVQIELLPGHAARHRGLSHGNRHILDEPRVERLGHDVVFAEAQAVHPIGAQDTVGHVLAGQRGQRARSCHLHLLIDGARPHV